MSSYTHFNVFKTLKCDTDTATGYQLLHKPEVNNKDCQL